MAFVLAAFAAAHPAHADVAPTLMPQWIAAQTEDALVFDRIAASVDPVTVAMPDGGAVAATVANGELVLRRYAADGSVALARSVPVDLGGSSDVEIVLRSNATHDAFYVLAGGVQSPATLMRLDASFEPGWSLALPAESICGGEDGHCLRLERLGDDSLVAMRAYRTLRVGDDGTVQWSVVDPGLANGFWGGDLAIGETAIWVATSGGTGGPYDAAATLTRLDFDGTRLSADISSCQGCGGATLSDIETTADGGARVVGSIGGHALYARYDALGFPLLSATADAGAYVWIGHDANGATFVLAGTPYDRSARRIDPSNGNVAWSMPTDDFVVLDDGIVTIRRASGAITASAVDAQGATAWTLPLGSYGGGLPPTSRPRRDAGAVELLVDDATASDDPCAPYPRIVRIDGAGNPTWFDRPCRTRPESALVWSIDAQSGTGVLVNTLAHLSLYSPNGDLRWRLHACAWCSDDSSPSAWAAAMLAQDGGVWAMRWDQPSLADPDGRTLIERYDALGDPVFAAESLVNGGSVFNYYDRIVIRPGPSDLVMLFAGGQTLYWQRVADDGSALTVRTHPVSDMFFHIEDARRLPDGSTVVLTKGWGYCNVGCPPFYVTVLHIAQGGELVAHYEFPEPDAPWIPAALDADGNAAGILRNANSLRIRSVDADGSVHETDIAGIDSDHNPSMLTSVSSGRWWLQAESNFGPGDLTHALVDDKGSLLAERHDGAYAWLSQTTPLGVFVHAPDLAPQEHVALLDSITLAERARFDVGTGQPTGPRNWAFADDGSVYGTITLPQSELQAIARYSVPGTTPSDVIFRNAFD